MREIRIHDDDEVTGRELHAVHVRGSQSEFAGAGFEDDVVGAVGFDELFGDILGAVGGAVVDDDDFVVEFSSSLLLGHVALH